MLRMCISQCHSGNGQKNEQISFNTLPKMRICSHQLASLNIFAICIRNSKQFSRTSFLSDIFCYLADFATCTSLSYLCNSISLCLPLCNLFYLCLAWLEMLAAGYVISGVTMSHGTYQFLLVVLFQFAYACAQGI